MSALLRVLRAPVLWGSLVLLHWGIAAAFAAPVRGLVAAILGDHAVQSPGRLLPYVLELFADNPSLGPAIGAAIVTAMILSAILGLLSAGGVIRRLAGERGAAVGVANAIRHLRPIAVLSFYGLVPRVVVAIVLVLGAGWLRALLALAVWSLCSAGEGIARASVVLEPGRPYHPIRLIHGFRDAILQPKIWAMTALLTAALAGITLASLMIITRTLGPGTDGLWAVRGLSIVTVGLALWRTAIFVDVVEARRADPKRVGRS